MAIDPRSEKTIETLVPKAKEYARAFLEAVRSAGHEARLISGTRSYAEQAKLFAIGRTTDIGKPRVTNAPPGRSNHNFGIAWDLGVFKAGKYVPESPEYAAIGPIGEELGLEWGGSWKTIVDRPHYQVKTGLTLPQLDAIVRKHGGWLSPDAMAEIDSLVPALNSKKKPADPPSITDVAVDIYAKSLKVPVRGFLRDSRVYVAARDFANYFGGDVIEVDDTVTHVKLEIAGEEVAVPVIQVSGSAFAKFADINAALGWEFKYDTKTKRLTVG